jgi:hypothetical protein
MVISRCCRDCCRLLLIISRGHLALLSGLLPIVADHLALLWALLRVASVGTVVSCCARALIVLAVSALWKD